MGFPIAHLLARIRARWCPLKWLKTQSSLSLACSWGLGACWRDARLDHIAHYLAAVSTYLRMTRAMIGNPRCHIEIWNARQDLMLSTWSVLRGLDRFGETPEHVHTPRKLDSLSYEFDQPKNEIILTSWAKGMASWKLRSKEKIMRIRRALFFLEQGWRLVDRRRLRVNRWKVYLA